MTRRAYFLPMALFAVLGLAALGGLKLAKSQANRPNCPGKIVCPQTGELICRDRCPTVDPNRPDCPGRITCPQTGEWVCRDRCPLGRKSTTTNPPESKVPSCCAKQE